MAKVKKSNNYLGYALVVAGVLGLTTFTLASQKKQSAENSEAAMGRAICNDRYNPDTTASNFTTDITNQYAYFNVGKKLVYEGDTEDGRERIVISIPGTTKNVRIGNQTIRTLVYRDTVWIDSDDDGKFESNELHEDVKDYIAQRKDTKDVWYFGEDVNYYEDGELVGHEGTWLAGQEGAKPGIFVKHDPKVGDSFLQECWEGEAEDTVDVISTTARANIELGRFRNCVKTYDYNPNDPESKENKFYCTTSLEGKAANAKVLQVDKITGNRIELVRVRNNTERANPDDNRMAL